MKTNLKGLLVIFSIAMISCNHDTQQEYNDLLTSTNWTDKLNPISAYPETHYTFHKNGKYTLDSGEFKVTGLWKWTGRNEIYLEIKSITVNGMQEDFDGKQNYFLRILEISENNLKTLERFETDAWNSGFAKERNYKPN